MRVVDGPLAKKAAACVAMVGRFAAFKGHRLRRARAILFILACPASILARIEKQSLARQIAAYKLGKLCTGQESL